MPVTIVSRDKDLTQLLSPVDMYWDAIADVRYAYDDIEERFGVIPERMADFLALMGDAVDNIPGVPGVGRKTAQKLLKHFDTLHGVFENLDEVRKLKFRNASFVADSLREHRETAFLSRQLTGDCVRHAVAAVEGQRTAPARARPRDGRHVLRGPGPRPHAARTGAPDSRASPGLTPSAAALA